MSASVGGGSAGMFALLMISLIFVGVLFFYGAFIAYKGARNMTSLALLVGFLLVILGVATYFITAIIVYNNYGEFTTLTENLIGMSFLFLACGLLIAAISFVLYIQAHNKLLRINNT